MNQDDFNRLMDDIRIGERYYALVDSIGKVPYVHSSGGLKVADLKSAAEKVLGQMTYDKRDRTISSETKVSDYELIMVARILHGCSCELLLSIKAPGWSFGNNLPVLALAERTRNVRSFIREPPYPRIGCRDYNDLVRSLSFALELKSLLIERLEAL